MRLFVAVEVGEAVSAEAIGLVQALRRRVSDAHHAKLTWAAADRLHLTVRFIGEAEIGRASCRERV